jgi:hypothetical protein
MCLEAVVGNGQVVAGERHPRRSAVRQPECRAARPNGYGAPIRLTKSE